MADSEHPTNASEAQDGGTICADEMATKTSDQTQDDTDAIGISQADKQNCPQSSDLNEERNVPALEQEVDIFVQAPECDAHVSQSIDDSALAQSDNVMLVCSHEEDDGHTEKNGMLLTQGSNRDCDDTLPESDRPRSRHTSIRSLSESSSGSDVEYRMARLDESESGKDLELSQIDCDAGIGSSSVLLCDRDNSQPHEDDLLTEIEKIRQVSGSVMSNTSSYSWMRDGAMGSAISVDPDSALGRIRADIALEQKIGSGDAASQEHCARLSDKLEEGPTLILPTTTVEERMSEADRDTSVVFLPQSDMDVNNSMSSSSQEPSQSISEETVTPQLSSGFNHERTYAEAVQGTDPAPSMEQPCPKSSAEGVFSTPSVQLESSAAIDTPANVASEVLTPVVATESLSSSTVIALPSLDATASTIPVVSPASTSATTEAAVVAATSTSPVAVTKPRVKKTPNDFIFGKVIGEGSYSTVYLAKEVSSQKEFAIKVCEKKHLIRERKTHFVMREKEVFMKLDHPFFVKLAYTFQDSERLYYVLTYARNGELLGYLHKLSVFDVPCTRFYTAEIIVALEYLHNLGIIHRDLKPENILLSDDMHIKITDFGTSKVLQIDQEGNPVQSTEAKKKNSFVGTAEYVSPEVLNNHPANFGSDLWALGCIIYQCLSGSMPFRSGNEYQTFQKIVKAEYTFPEGFNEDAKDLVSKLLVLEPDHRLGMPATGGMASLKAHNFYKGVDWSNLPTTTPPKLMPYLPATSHNPEFWGQDHRVGFDDQRLAEIISGQNIADGSLSPELEEVPVRGASPIDNFGSAVDMAREEKLDKQRRENQFHHYVKGNLIIKQGFVDKRKGLFARKRMLLLTEGPHLYYVDAHHKVLKGEIPWSKYLRPEAKNFKIFFVHTPNRTYYLESRLPDAQMWVKKIKEVWKRYYSDDDNDKT